MELATELKEGLLLIDKPQGRTSFSLIRALTKLIGVKKSVMQALWIPLLQV